MNDEAKDRILAWRQENVIMKKICRRTKSARSSVMTFLAAARDLLQNVIPATKPLSGRPPKTSKHTDDVVATDIHVRLPVSVNTFLSTS